MPASCLWLPRRVAAALVLVSTLASGCSEDSAGRSAAPGGRPAGTTLTDVASTGSVTPPGTPAMGSTGSPGPSTAAAVLHRWDRARARAWAAGDVGSLARLYVPGSSAGAADVGLLRRYLRRGLRVEGLRMQLLALEELDRARGRLLLRVTDRVADGATAVGAGTRIRLPSDSASTRLVELVRVDRRWQVVAVSDPAPLPAGR